MLVSRSCLLLSYRRKLTLISNISPGNIRSVTRTDPPSSINQQLSTFQPVRRFSRSAFDIDISSLSSRRRIQLLCLPRSLRRRSGPQVSLVLGVSLLSPVAPIHLHPVPLSPESISTC
jgi:hypothetical protein